jgi:peptidoglycan L-alanyl-D-glutamate endopeptidase CwlK
MSLYAQGRTKPGPVVTNTLNSYHVQGRAFDIAFMGPQGVTYDVPSSWWPVAGQLGEQIGWRWGGRWKNPDRPHFEA